MNNSDQTYILERIGTFQPTAAHLLGAYQDELESVPVSDRHKADHLRRIRLAWQQRQREEISVAAHLASLDLGGYPAALATRILQRAITETKANASSPTGNRFARIVRNHAEAATREAYLRILAAWLTGVPAAVTAWFEAADTAGDQEDLHG